MKYMQDSQRALVIVAISFGIGGLAPMGWAATSAQEAPATAAPAAAPSTAPASPQPAEAAWIDGELPAGAKTTGTWLWDQDKNAHSHPPAKGMQSHSVTFAAPVSVPANGEIVTSVWLDPADPPRGIMVKFTLENGEETGVYWEGEEEVFNPGENEEIWYYGLLPEFGTWTPLTVAAEDLGIEDGKITGMTFVTYDGRVLWGRTLVRPAAATPELPAGSEGDVPKATP